MKKFKSTISFIIHKLLSSVIKSIVKMLQKRNKCKFILFMTVFKDILQWEFSNISHNPFFAFMKHSTASVRKVRFLLSPNWKMTSVSITFSWFFPDSKFLHMDWGELEIPEREKGEKKFCRKACDWKERRDGSGRQEKRRDRVEDNSLVCQRTIWWMHFKIYITFTPL